MIQHIRLVAAREFRQVAMTRSFWLTLLILPLVFALGPLASRFMDKSDTDTVMVIDQAGGSAGAAIRQRVELDGQRATLDALARYVRRHDLQRADPSAPWAQGDHWFGDAEVARFVASGGLPTARAAIARVSPKNAEAFDAPDPDYRVVDTPPALATAAPATLDQALEPYLRPGDKSNRKPVDYVILIPHDFGPSPAIRVWANGAPRGSLMAMLQGVLTPDLRTRFLAGAGTPAATAQAANAVAPAIQVTTPPPGSGRERMLIRSILPLACAYILLMSLVLSGSWMLQGTVEERSNELLETVLACISPSELMYGKLAGTVAIGLSMILTWAACGAFAAYATHGAIADVIRPALEPVSSLGSVLTILYFFVAGYMMVAMIFLVIGAVSNSMRDAQGYLMPVILLIMMPFTLLVQAVLRGAGGTAVEVLTWVPLWSPFTVLARLGTGIPTWEVVGSGVVLAAFVVIEILLLGRVFRASLLNEGRRSLPEMLKLMRQPG
ncbi:MAG: ABC transporter permease [Sphingomonas sp.]|uniref:ABC transporter permease n=1 Tax=Sphingomonas sp. TaxID=28214 RepID=UPI001AC3597A|nr:ABC transporter permease [Sphingomonas sp.]MBN8808207.1 ABC transporter permease [Sphingomonas sp.]